MLKFICFSAFVVVASAAPRAAPLAWTDCSTDPSTRVLTVHEFDFQPNPIVIPGELHVTLNATVNRRIDQLFIDTELIQLGGLFGRMTVPCIYFGIGSCQNVDGCSSLNVASYYLGEQFDKLLGHNATCPINPESVVIHNKLITLRTIPSPVSQSAFADGTYSMKITLKDDPTSTENIGCLSFNAGFARKSSGFLFGDGGVVGKK